MVVQAQMISGDAVKQSSKAQFVKSRKEDTAITGECMHKHHYRTRKCTWLFCDTQACP
jgi:hypothetical protein